MGPPSISHAKSLDKSPESLHYGSRRNDASIQHYQYHRLARTTTVHGGLDALDADYVIEGSDGPDYFGMGLAAGDFDQDGKPELAVGAPDTYAYRQSTVGDRGRVSVYDLTEGRVTEKARFQGMGRQDTFGQSLRAWDLDGDGSDELIVDAPGHEGGGRVYFLTWTP